MEALKRLYHPDKVNQTTFIKNFSIRIKEFQAITTVLHQQRKKPLQHFLITGKRGLGKSTLLRRVFYEADSEPLHNKMIAVWLGSEQYRLSRLYKLWEQVIENLATKESQLLIKKSELELNPYYEE